MFSILSKSFIMPMTTLTNLERMIVSRAVGSSLISTISSEWSIDRIALDLITIHNHNSWILSILCIYAYGYYKLFHFMDEKLDNVPVYDKLSRIIKDILFVFFLVFTRDIPDAI